MTLADVDLQAWGFFLARNGLMLLTAFAVLIGSMYLWFRMAARPQPPLSRELIGKTGTSLTVVSAREGRIKVDGVEIRAVSPDRILAGAPIRVVEVDGLIAKIAPAE
ncbi:MAG TPA: NfeD family protein [bacterium]|nr:NfeD family protein [bacterium]